MSKNVVTLDVGGTIFRTTRSTLQRSGYFEAMLNGPWAETVQDGKPIFIDRDPENFRHVLGVLRDPQHELPNSMLYELDYFQIQWAYPKKKDPSLVEDVVNHTDGKQELTHERIFPLHSTFLGSTILETQGLIEASRSDQIRSRGCPVQTTERKEPTLSLYTRRTIEPRTIGNNTSFVLSDRIGDTITDLILRFTLDSKEWREDYDPRYDAIERIEFQINETIIDSIVGPALQLLDIVHMPREKRRSRKILEAQTHTITVRLPFFCCGTSQSLTYYPESVQHMTSSFPIIALPYQNIRINVRFKHNMILNDCHLDIEYCLLTKSWKKRLLDQTMTLRIWQHQYEQCYITDTAKELHIFRFHYRLAAHAFYWAVQGKETGKFYPIVRTQIKIHSSLIYDCYDKTCREYMLLDPECHATGLIPVYYWSLGDGSIDGSRVHELTFLIELEPQYDNEPLEFFVMAKTRNYLRIHDREAHLIFH